MIRSSRKVWLTACLAALGMALSGCSSHPGAAAIVNGTTISESQLDRTAEQIEANGGKVPPRPDLLQFEINAAIAMPILDQSPAFTEDGKVAMVNECIQRFADAEDFFGRANADTLPESIKATCYLQFVGQVDPEAAEALERARNETSITLSPRYGKLTDDGEFVQPEYLEYQ